MTLKDLVPIQEYVPTIYKDVKEMDAFCESLDFLWDVLISSADEEYARMFIQSSDEIGVERFERILKITADPSIESLDFRKERLLTRCNSTLPYTTIWLRNYLNSVLGYTNYELEVDYENLAVKLYGYLLNYSWAKEVGIMIRHILPANVIFINVPTLIQSIELQDWLDEGTWNSDIWNDENYWSELNIIPKDELQKYQPLPNGHPTPEYIMGKIKSIRLNETETIKNIKKSIQDGVIHLEFRIPETTKLLTYLEVIDVNDGVLVYTPCYIDSPSGTTTIMKITCYERKAY